ncbi:MAG: YitT family protein [Prolixibacteraceae bacterium]|jgi:uncharacterized membrane-anchored protein YitT (DUF2179 family)|nr:YitT family protein [Prolixibacteraceae bacterium]
MKLSVDKIKAYGIMFLGSLLFSLGWTVFLIPAEINGGGISGVGALIYYVTNIPAGVTYLAVNTILVTIAIIKLGANIWIRINVGSFVHTRCLLKRSEPIGPDIYFF